MNNKRKLTQVSWLGLKTIVFTSFRKLAIILILFFTLFGLTNPVFANQTNNPSIGRISNLDPAQDEATSTPISIITDSPTNTPVEPESTATDVPLIQTPVLTETSESITPTATVELPTITQTDPAEPSTVTPTQAQISPTATITPTAVPPSKEILPMALGSPYYVSTSGSNSNPGTFASPWKTLSYAAGKLIAGDTLYIRGGTYSEHFSLSADGTQTSPITVTNYNGETVIVDGVGMTIPAHNSGTPLLEVKGDWVIVSNLTISNSGEQGVSVEGVHDLLDNLYVHHSWANGVVLKGNYSVAQNMSIWSNSMQNEGGTMSVGWGTGISCARYPDFCTIRKSTAWDNWGEGISTFEALDTTIEDNISYNNMQNYYVSDTQNTLFQRNLSYYTPGTVMDFNTITGILIGDELGVPVPLPNGTRQSSKNNTFINNLFVGGNNGIMASTSVLTNDLFANNTWANSAGATNEQVNILFNSGTCTNCRFTNNLILQDDSRTIVSVEGSGITFSNNLWSKAPSSKASGSGDIIGDPQLAKTGSITPGQLTADYFKLLANSPAINKATSLSQVDVDYFLSLRGSQPDIGAIEFDGAPVQTNTPVTPTATRTNTPVMPTATRTNTPVIPLDSSAFTFVIMSDAQDGGSVLPATANQALGLNPNFGIFAGDLESGGVSSTMMNTETSALGSLYPKILFVRGNHDDQVSGSSGLWENYFVAANRSLPAGVTNLTGLYASSLYLNYSFDYGNSRFIGLDVPGDADLLTTAQLTFLDTRLTDAENIGLVHAFIFFHGPPYCAESTHCSCTAKNDAKCTPASLITVINKHPIVEATFSGHEHLLAWTHMDSSRVASLTHPYEQFLTAPSGTGTYNQYLYSNRVDYANLQNAMAFGAVSVDGASFTVNFYRVGTTAPVWSKTFSQSGTPTNTPTPTATRTNTPVTLTATRTNTPVTPIPTRTNTPVAPTATRTNTSVPPTPTNTKTALPPTATRTPTVTSTPTSTPLPPPNLVDPANHGTALTTRPTFTWGVITGATSYTIQLSTSSGFSSLTVNQQVATFTYTLTSDLTRKKTYYWRVRANGAKSSAWSQVFTFVSADPPVVPSLSKPANGTLLSNYQPKLDWHGVADSYQVQLGYDSLFSASNMVFDVKVDAGTHLDLTTPLATDHNYYWRVRAFDSVGQYSLWSTSRYFKTAMLPPTLQDPGASGSVLTTRPTFDWATVHGATGYRIQISKVSTFSSRVIDKTVTSISYIPTTDLPRKVPLYWRVSALGSRPSAWSAVSSFTSADPPAIPSLLAPANKSILGTYLPILDWKDPAKATQYRVQVANSSSFSVSDIIIDTMATPSSTTPLSPLTPNRTFFWRVSSYNEAKEYSGWSAVRSFNTRLPAPALLLPGNLGTASTTTNLEWKDVKEATGYTIQISTNASFSSYVVNTTITNSNYSKSLAKGQKYYWRVNAKGTFPSLWSEVRSFTTQ